MDTSTCTTIVLVLLWLYLCCQALGSLVALIPEFPTTAVLSSTTTISTVLLTVCIWQCHRAGYLVSPMTWYHWVLLVLLVLLQIMALLLAVLEHLNGGTNIGSYTDAWTYPIYGIAAVLLVVLGGTLYCGWKCNLFCRPCCKSQYICYGSAIVVALLLLLLLAVVASLIRYNGDDYGEIGQTEIRTIVYLDKIMVVVTQCYAAALLWNTTLRLPYSVPEVMALISSTLAMASLFAVAIVGGSQEYKGLSNTIGYSLLSLHLIFLGITWYCLEYKSVFYWPKDHMCFGVLVAVLVVALTLVVMVLAKFSDQIDDQENVDDAKYTLIGYSIILMVPTLWYAYRCDLLTWCLPKKKELGSTDTAENTAPDTDIAKES